MRPFTHGQERRPATRTLTMPLKRRIGAARWLRFPVRRRRSRTTYKLTRYDMLDPRRRFAHAPTGIVPPVKPLACVLHPTGYDTGRVLVLLRGYNTRATSYQQSINQWAFHLEDLAPLYSRVVYFSYNASNAETYTREDTHHSLWEHHIPLLVSLLEACHAQGWRSFDLIGHSLGGVVASEYIMRHGLEGSQAGWVRNVITLDAPINGAHLLRPRSMVRRLWPDRSEEHLPVIQEIIAVYLGRTHYGQLRLRLLKRLHEAGINYWNLTNTQDWYVNVEDATLPGSGYTYSLGRKLLSRDSGQRGGHSQIFEAAAVREDMRSLLSGETKNPRHTTAAEETSNDQTTRRAATWAAMRQRYIRLQQHTQHLRHNRQRPALPSLRVRTTVRQAGRYLRRANRANTDEKG